ncbi:uncharacterized protein LOC144231829 [Crocuta crocuta]
MSAQVSGCGGGSGVSEALALPQSPPCNPDPRERARERGRGIHEQRPLASQAHSTGSPASARPRALHAPEFPTLVTGFRALRGRRERHGISSAASVPGVKRLSTENQEKGEACSNNKSSNLWMQPLCNKSSLPVTGLHPYCPGNRILERRRTETQNPE